MNRQRAKEILMLYRPGAPEAQDPETIEALAFARQDPELQQWFTAYTTLQNGIRRQMRTISVPAGLKEQILSERPQPQRPAFPRRGVLVLAAAVIVLLAGIASLWLRSHEGETSADKNYAAYRRQMVREAMRVYSMDLFSSDLAQVRAFLATNHYPADFTVPAGLSRAKVDGCVLGKWRGHPVTLVCYKTEQAVIAGQTSDLWLFVVDQTAVPDPPQTQVAAPVNLAITSSWAADGKIYMLATPGHEIELLRQYL